MYTNFGIPAACAQATRGIRVRGFITWTDFEMKYTPAVTSSSSSVKGVLMAAFALWVSWVWFSQYFITFLKFVGLVRIFNFYFD